MNIEDLESIEFVSSIHELESYNYCFKDFDVYSLNKDSLKKYLKIFRTLISDVDVDKPTFKFKTIDYLFGSSFVFLIVLFIISKQYFLLPFLGYDIYVLIKEYGEPLKNWFINKKNKKTVNLGLENVSKLLTALEMHQGEILDVNYVQENKHSNEIDINYVIEQIENKFKYLDDEIMNHYYSRYTLALAKYYSGESNQELIDLLIELNELNNNTAKENIIEIGYTRNRIIKNK